MARRWKSSKDVAIVIVCAAHAIVFWMVARDKSYDSHEHLMGSIAAQTSLSPSSIAGGKLLEDIGKAEIDSDGACNSNDYRAAAAVAGEF